MYDVGAVLAALKHLSEEPVRRVCGGKGDGEVSPVVHETGLAQHLRCELRVSNTIVKLEGRA